MMASLRARLVAGLLAVAAVGLVLLAGITYVEQRSFLLDRVDEQLTAAPGAVARALDEAGVPDGRPDPADGPRGEPGPGGPGVGLPPGTYGQRRDAGGRVLGEVVLAAFGDETTAEPDLPARLPEGRIVEADGYRVLAADDPFGDGLLVVAVPLEQTQATLRRLLLVEALVIAGVLALLGVMTWIVVRVGLRPLDRMGATAGAIAGGDLSQRVSPSDGRTEVGRLGLALNAMLDRLERAFAERRRSEDRLRRFIADASHELRTPLASIRGYAELVRMGAAADPADAAKAMRRIEEEAARMGVLVEDLLTLARLDEVRDSPHALVDLAVLAGDGAADARATAPDRAITARAEGDVTVLGDEDRLRQVLGNLLRNALVHTPPGTAVEVDARRDGDAVRLTVRDHGPGLPPGDHAELFERFWRAAGGRARGPAGAGLGLAIVAAIVDAHHGSVRADDAPGGGAAFTITLPAAA